MRLSVYAVECKKWKIRKQCLFLVCFFCLYYLFFLIFFTKRCCFLSPYFSISISFIWFYQVWDKMFLLKASYYSFWMIYTNQMRYTLALLLPSQFCYFFTKFCKIWHPFWFCIRLCIRVCDTHHKWCPEDTLCKTQSWPRGKIFSTFLRTTNTSLR